MGSFTSAEILLMLVTLVILGTHMGLALWVAKDARARNVNAVTLWVLGMVFCGSASLVVYLLTRPPKDYSELS
jgi:hypothetical protein